jgi:hypothetical protein
MSKFSDKSNRARSSGITLTEDDARIAKGMLQRNDRQHDIAAWFGVNGGRIAEIATGRAFNWVEPAPHTKLPPPGPYPNAKKLMEAQQALDDALNALVAAEATMKTLMTEKKIDS